MKQGQIHRRKRELRMKLPLELRALPFWEEIADAWQLCHVSKFFPIDTPVTVKGKLGLYRVVSDPFLLRKHGYPRINAESSKEMICVKVTEVNRISN